MMVTGCLLFYIKKPLLSMSASVSLTANLATFTNLFLPSIIPISLIIENSPLILFSVATQQNNI